MQRVICSFLMSMFPLDLSGQKQCYNNIWQNQIALQVHQQASIPIPVLLEFEFGKLNVYNFFVSALPVNKARMNLVFVGRLASCLHEGPSSKPTCFNTFRPERSYGKYVGLSEPF